MAQLLDPITFAKQYIDANYDRPLSLEEIAKQVHFSPYHFLRCFRQQYALTPHAYLTHLRMARARELLAETDRSVTEICLDVGYESLGSFSSLFRRYVGHSPYHYRARVFQSVQIARTAERYIPYCFIFMRGWGQRVDSQNRTRLPQEVQSL